MSVLVDTSVWILALRGTAPFAKRLHDLLLRDEVMRHPMVHGELLLGDVGGGRRHVLELYERMHASARISDHDDVLALVRARRLNGKGLGWVDAHLLASALLEGVRLWSADDALADAARAVGVAFSA
jgi:predicted nucleic acid-binding protein